MADGSEEVHGKSCCRLRFPSIPKKWLLFIDFAFTLGTSLVYLADIITDVFTLKVYWDRGWYYAFGFSMGFIIAPSILLAILECQFLIKTYGKNTKWSTVVVRTLLNIPFQLTVIWYHLKLSWRYWRVWRDEVHTKGTKPITAEDRKVSMANLADLDDRANTIERRAIASNEVPVASDISGPPAAYDGNTDHTWWKQLTREEWLSHLNKMKLTESMLESLPQLLINLYLIVIYSGTPVLQYLSATLSYLSLCGGIVRYDKTRKDNEADRLMVDRTLLHSRAFATRLEWPQILFISLYKGCFLAARILVFVYFTVYFQVYILIFIFIHWFVLMAYLVYLWYPTDLHKKTRQLVQADYKFRAYMFLSQDFLSVFHNSLVGIFISVRPQNYAFLGQPYCYLFWFYFTYIIENIVLFMIPGVYFSMRNEEEVLLQYEYYIVLICELTLNVFGAVLCLIYYFSVHKMGVYTRNAYPQFSKLQSTGICCCCDITPAAPKEWTVCKQAETSEIFYLRRDKLKEYKSGYTTVVRVNRQKGRNLECFIDERGKIFYAPRNKLFKKVPSHEEELVVMHKEASRRNLDHLHYDSSSQRPDSLSTFQNERLVGEEFSCIKDEEEFRPLISTSRPPPPLPDTPPRSFTPVGKSSARGSASGSGIEKKLPSTIPIHVTKDISPKSSARSSARSSKSRQSEKLESSQREGPKESHRDISTRSSRSTSAKSSERSRKREEAEPSPEKESRSHYSPLSHSSSKHSSARSRGRSPRNVHRSSPPENGWKAHGAKDPDLPDNSGDLKSESIKNSGDGELHQERFSQKSQPLPENQGSNDAKPRKGSPKKHKNESNIGTVVGETQNSGRSPSKHGRHGKSRQHSRDSKEDHSSKSRSSEGGPVGQTWI